MWAPHEWAPEDKGRHGFLRGEKCNYKKCKSKFSPYLRFMTRDSWKSVTILKAEHYDRDWVNNYD